MDAPKRWGRVVLPPLVIVVLLAITASVAAAAVIPFVLGATQSTRTSQPPYSAEEEPDGRTTCHEARMLINDGRPSAARSLIETARKAGGAAGTSLCPDEFDAALIGEGQLERGAVPDPTPAQQFAYAWSRFVDGVATPLTEFGLVFLGGLAAFLLISRLSVGLAGRVLRHPDPRPIRAWYRTAGGVVCIVLMVLFALALPLTIALGAVVSTLPAALIWAAVPAAALGGVSAACGLGLVLATRLRMTIELMGKSADAAVAPRLAALIVEIGGALPRGPEIPIGSDVTAMRDNVLAVKSSNAWVAAVQSVLGLLFVTSPWHIVIGGAGTDELSLVVSRNGSSVAGYAVSVASIARARDGDADGAAAALKDYLLEFAASAVVTTMQRYYSGFEGLCGTTDWKSLGLQYIATTRVLLRETRQRLLAWAIDADAANLLALIALRGMQARTIDARVDHERYLAWLRAALETIREIDPHGPFQIDGAEAGVVQARVTKGREEAHVRLLLMAVTTALNLRGTSGAPVAVWITREVENLRVQITLLKNRRSGLYKSAEPAAAIWKASAEIRPGTFDTSTFAGIVRRIRSASPYVAENAASYFVLVLFSESASGKWDEAFFNLQRCIVVAALDPDRHEGIRKDPILRTQAGLDWFEAVVRPSGQ